MKRCGTCHYWTAEPDAAVGRCNWRPPERRPTWVVLASNLFGPEDGANCEAWTKPRRAAASVANYNASCAIALHAALRGHGRGAWAKTWEPRVGYSDAELRQHLESKFDARMSWKNYGEWHVDHVRPLSSFEITDFDCPAFRAAWALKNLQPLWAKDNLKKGARWDG